MRQPTVRCVDFVESVTDWMEGALADADRVTIEEHLSGCPRCTEYAAHLRLAADVLHEQPSEAPPEAARTALLEMFRRHRANG